MASADLLLKPLCSGCSSTTELYGSNCKHMTLCLTCGKTMVENHGKCYQCGETVTRLIREYNVRARSSSDKNYFIGRFATGLPIFSKKKSAENEWSLQKEGLLGRQITDTLKEKYKNKPWLLEDETGQSQYHGQLEGASSATYYLLMLQGKEFVATPAGSWYNFNKVAQYKQLTLEEAEEKIKNRRRTADGYERWMMKAANNGAELFAEASKCLDKEIGTSGGNSGRGRKKSGDDDDVKEEKVDEDEEEEAGRITRLGHDKRSGDDDEEDDAPRGDFDDDDDIERGDDWEHEEIFTDDDETVGNDPEERDDLGPELPAPPEIKDDDDDDEEDENDEEGEGLSKSGKELKKLLGRANGLNDSEAEDDDDSDDSDDEDRPSPVFAPKSKEVVKDEPADNSPAKTVPGGSSKGTASTSKSAKGKRKVGDEAKIVTPAVTKKVKTETDTKSSTKDDGPKASASAKVAPQPSSKAGTGSVQMPVSEDEIRAVLLQRAPITTQELVANFKARLRSSEDKKAFAEILKRISKIQKTTNGQSYVVLRG